MRCKQEVFLGFERVRRMAPVAAREDPKLPAVYKLLQLRLDCGEIDSRRIRRNFFGQRFGSDRVGPQGADDVHPVQRAQVIEVNRVIVQVLSAHQEVADDPGIGRNRQPGCVFHGAYRCLAVDIGAHPA